MIREDKHCLSKLDLTAIEKGIAKLDIHSLRINRRQYTEEEKEENRKLANSVSEREWGIHCKDNNKKTAEKIERLLDLLNKEFVIYQYKKNISFRSNWDLFFWCRSEKEKRDLSYVTLSPNRKRGVEQTIADINNVLECIKKSGLLEELDVYIQYTATYNEKLVQEIITDYFYKIKGTFVPYLGYVGKIKYIGKDSYGNPCYGFFKKKARSRYFPMSNKKWRDKN